MSNSHIEGRVVRISRPASSLYSLFSDLTNFTRNLPQDMRDKADIKSTPDTLVASVQGFEIGMKVCERSPFTYVKYDHYGSTPIPFAITVNLNDLGNGSCDFQLIMDTQLSGMFKMMLGGKLQEVVDKITDEIERAMGAMS
ncbi:MAG: hypothetical protein Q8R90_09775 [Bacteroidales bacterium]|nr:hypothetical protein [Bacteroidales bacterium]